MDHFSTSEDSLNVQFLMNLRRWNDFSSFFALNLAQSFWTTEP